MTEDDPKLNEFILYCMEELDSHVFQLDNVSARGYDMNEGHGDITLLNGTYLCVHVDVLGEDIMFVWWDGNRIFLTLAPKYIITFLLMGKLTPFTGDDDLLDSLHESYSNNLFYRSSFYVISDIK